MNILQKLFRTEPSSVVNPTSAPIQNGPIGDGQAVFLEDATDDEFEEYQHNETHGWGKWKEIVEIIKRP